MEWPTKKLCDVLDIQNGYAFDSKQFSSEEGMPLIRIRDISNGLKTVTNYAGEYKSIYVVRKGDFLIGMDGEFRCYEWKGEDALLNQRVCRLQNFSDELSAKFLSYGINKYLQDIEDVTGFTTVKHISASQIKNIEFPIPPIPEQQRIVSILDQAFADIEKARANTEKNLKNVRELFDSYLNQVFSGLSLGSSWPSVRLKSIVDRLTNGFVGPTRDIYKDSGVPYLLARQVKNNVLKFDGRTYVSDEFNIKNKKSLLKKGDVLLVQSGHIGHSAVVPAEHEGHNCHAMIVITPKDELTGDFLSFYFSFLLFTGRISDIRSGSTVPHLTCKLVKELLIPLPPVSEQNSIVENIRTLSEQTKQLEATCENKLKSLDELKKTLLQKAFSGELTKTKDMAA